jgi:hypothetical protein
LILAIASGRTAAQPTVSREYQVKAAFLFNFAQFVEWPTNTFTNAEAPFVIGVLGDDPFGNALEETIRGETIKNHKLVILRSKRAEDLQNCQLIFVSKSEHAHEAEILSRCTARKILTVSEIQGFANHGGIINFFADGKKIRFEINPATAEREGLKISSQLLSLGKIVETDPKGGR